MTSKAMLWTGRAISWSAGFFMFTSGINLMFVRSPDMMEGFATFGIPEDTIFGIGVAALVSSILYLIPRTSVFGAVLLTGYLGGAVATHVRVHDPVGFAPLLVGILIWLGLWLRDEQLRALLPLRR
jgi:hypothetical protein